MSIDIVEIAFEHFTDGALFEKLACEVMRDEGYHDIKRLGGSHDFGMDAVGDVFYEQGGPHRIVFQFTLEDYVLGKLRETIEKLRKNEIVFQELVLVAGSALSPQRVENVRKTARKEYGVTATCYERGTLLNRLSDYENGIFHRHFPDIQKQIAEMQAVKPVFRDTDHAREVALLRTAIAFGAAPASRGIRNSMFDQLVLATLEAAEGAALTISEISASLSSSLGVERFPDSQIAASLGRLGSDVVGDGNSHSLTPEHEVRVDTATTRVNHLTESLISDVIEDLCTVAKERISLNERRQLEKNAKDVLRELFRLNSLPLANIATPDSIPDVVPPQEVAGLFDLAKRHTTAERGELLLAVLASLLAAPTPEQAHVLAGWARIYLGIALMNLDPACRECQVTQLRTKLFVLDTDMLLGALVRENPAYTSYRTLIQKLGELGVHVAIPRSVIAECANHAARSPRTYNYHGERLLSMTPAVVDVEVRNLFVRSYYRAVTEHLIPRSWSYQQFLENYYDATDPIRFMTDLIRDSLPEEVEVIEADTLLRQPLPEEQLNTVKDKMREIMSRRQTIDTRTEEDSEALAVNDAKLMLTCWRLNTEGLTDTSRRILWAKCYLVTNSTRYLQAARELNLKNVVSTTPQHLIVLIENLTGTVASDSEVLRLLENPLLTHVVNDMWPDLEGLLKNGIGLTGKSLARLRCDLKSTLHEQLAAVEEKDRLTEQEADGGVATGSDYIELISSSQRLGYHIHPVARQAQDVFSAIDMKDQRIRELEEGMAEFEKIISHFGKKKQRYLRRMAKRYGGE